jgi:hypothetical protein
MPEEPGGPDFQAAMAHGAAPELDMVARIGSSLPAMSKHAMRERVWRDGLLVATGLLAVLAAADLAVMLPNVPSMVGHDHRLYMDATRRWLAGGDFYPAWQLAGPFTEASRPILYPPQALLLFVPFTFLPAVLWFALPTLLTSWVVIGHRPRRWTWPIMLALFAFWPVEWLPYISGTPTIWVVAAVAAGTRWGWPAALVLVKPTLAPFALIGIRHRGWWVTAAALAILGLVFAPMTLDWLRSVTNLTGSKSGLLYSLENLPLMALPLVAWLGRAKANTSSL